MPSHHADGTPASAGRHTGETPLPPRRRGETPPPTGRRGGQTSRRTGETPLPPSRRTQGQARRDGEISRTTSEPSSPDADGAWPTAGRRTGDTPPPTGRRPRTAVSPDEAPEPPDAAEPAARKGLRAALAAQADGHGHGHGHSHGPAAPASTRVRKLLIWLLVPLALATVVGMVVLYPWGKASPTSVVPQGTPVQASITATTTGPCLANGQVQVGADTDPDQKPCQTVDLTMTDGPGNGKPLRLIVPIEPSTPRFSTGDNVVLAYNGGNATDPSSFQLVDFQRGTPLVLLAALFALAVLVLGRWQGLAALVALVLSFVVIVLFVLPSILAGENPLVVAIAGAGAIMFVALYLTHGLSARTSVAVLGTLVSLALIGVLSAIFSVGASLTGLDDSTSTLIGSLGHGIDARGLLLAGIVIGALGVLDDVTVTQTSAVWELRRANPSLGWRELYRSGLRIGRDHVGSAVNTLVMAYAGAALPVLLYSSISGVGLGALLGSEDIASEIIRTLAGSVGIVAAVPVTTILAALIAAREPVDHLVSTTNTP
ncbi:YibE/F family protein [Amycolatopsis sp. DSM 110486]|nr:YibE/F family protein [Amycolatopsis sp. DSM 110486]QYN26547.1 YibE/F family protein [Amycolatopsis sp. DSM 110486]